jgi:hypothetical protein
MPAAFSLLPGIIGMFDLVWMPSAQTTYHELRERAERALRNRKIAGKKKSTRDEGLFKQVHKTVTFLSQNPRHPGLHTHDYDSILNPYDSKQKVFEAYAQNKTPGAYRVFWCYGPDSQQITIIAITPHP